MALVKKMQGIEIFYIFVAVCLLTDIVCSDFMSMFVTEYLKVFCMTYLYLCRNKMSTAKRFRPAPTVQQIQTDVLTKVCAW